MRMRTGVAVVSGIIAAKAALTWVALNAWASYPERPNEAHHWHVELGNVADWMAALGTVAAAIVALYIAGGESRRTHRERDNADLAQARLVLFEVDRHKNMPEWSVRVHNYGAQGILGVKIVDAYWPGRDCVTWVASDDALAIVKPDHEGMSGGTLRAGFSGPNGKSYPALVHVDPAYGNQYAEVEGNPNVVVQFMDANGGFWRVGTAVATERADGDTPPSLRWRARGRTTPTLSASEPTI